MNTNPWMQTLQNYSVADVSEMNWEPYRGLEMFLQAARPSQSHGATARSMLEMMQQGWNTQTFQNQQKGIQGPDWVNYLKDYDWDREFARLIPQSRREQPSKFMRPVRTITF